MRYAGPLLLAGTLVLGCGDAKKSPPAPAPAPAEAPKKITADDVTKAVNAAIEKRLGPMKGEANWVPAEHKAGKGRWRDATAYVDGKPIGMFWFGELPSTLKPVWIEEKSDDEFGPDTGPITTITKVRRYRFSDYLTAAGVDVKKIKAIHFYGPNDQILALTGKEFRDAAEFFFFRFGLDTEGKAIAVVPKDVGKNFDRLMGLAVYIDKKPPTLNDDGDLELDGKLVDGVPYFGEPLRGGIRVYKNDVLATVIKRNRLDGKLGVEGKDGSLRYKLADVLAAEGVSIADVAQLEVIYDERRAERFDRKAIQGMTFHSSQQARGEILLGETVSAHALALYTKPLPTHTASRNPDDDDPNRKQ